ncbi:MAG: carboxypeptidase-like regulatory domain-containing protein [Candidatus Woesearchaeota archaeon]
MPNNAAKKRELASVVSFVLIITAVFLIITLLSSTSAYAAGLCAHAEVCGQIYECGEPDNVCPEDFAQLDPDGSETAADCSINPDDCTDPECGSGCNATVHGSVSNEAGYPVIGADVTAFPSGNPSVSATTGGDGNYSMKTYGGYYLFSVEKQGYDVLSRMEKVHCGDNEINFTLTNGSCHADCTTWEAYCNQNCNGTIFPDEADKICEFADLQAMNVCDGKKKSTIARYNITHNIACCEGEPEPYEEIPATVSGDIEQIVKHTIITRYAGAPVKIILLLWKSI